MKKNVNLFIIGLLFSTTCFPQQQDVLCSQVDSIVKSINDNRPVFIASKTHQVVNGTDSCFREIFQDTDSKIMLITLNNWDNSGHQLVEYYFNDGILIFTKQVHSDHNGVCLIDQMYLYNGFIIRWIEPSGKNKDVNDDDFKKASLQLADFANTLVNEFKDRK
jgi:hypothetical protein